MKRKRLTEDEVLAAMRFYERGRRSKEDKKLFIETIRHLLLNSFFVTFTEEEFFDILLKITGSDKEFNIDLPISGSQKPVYFRKNGS